MYTKPRININGRRISKRVSLASPPGSRRLYRAGRAPPNARFSDIDGSPCADRQTSGVVNLAGGTHDDLSKSANRLELFGGPRLRSCIQLLRGLKAMEEKALWKMAKSIVRRFLALPCQQRISRFIRSFGAPAMTMNARTVQSNRSAPAGKGMSEIQPAPRCAG